MIALLIIFWQPFIAFFGNPNEIKAVVDRAGILGPLVFIILQALQIIIAPIPGQAVAVMAGMLFGPWLGTLYSLIGALIGFTAVFFLARQLGRPFVERFVEPKHLSKFDKLSTKAGPLVFFLIFLLPGFPDDVICYIAGLSKIPIRTLILISIAGRLPGYLLSGFAGAGIEQGNAWLIASMATAFVIALGIAYWKRKPLESWVMSLLDSDEDH